MNKRITRVPEPQEAFSTQIEWELGKAGTHVVPALQRTEQSTVGVNPGYPRLESGAIGVAPFAAVAVDNPIRIVPGCGQRLYRRRTANGGSPSRLCQVCGSEVQPDTRSVEDLRATAVRVLERRRTPSK